MCDYRGDGQIGKCENCGTASKYKYCSDSCKHEYHFRKRNINGYTLSVLALLAYGERDLYHESEGLRAPYMIAPLVEADERMCRLTTEGWRWLRYHFECDSARVLGLLRVSKPLVDFRYMAR